jgi:hypothetical protein
MTSSAGNLSEQRSKQEQDLIHHSPGLLLPTQLFVLPATNHKPAAVPTTQIEKRKYK